MLPGYRTLLESTTHLTKFPQKALLERATELTLEKGWRNAWVSASIVIVIYIWHLWSNTPWRWILGDSADAALYQGCARPFLHD
ncbi:MAG: hypothetical protein CFH41_01138 [Alphaproteobacteria bacterium MarineAlpha11_Bin1]|nr:MAG: hypothetical protein CFH41_01138 [Alphaproteobacteria bacterium MarineAlpha11_Bin1]